MTEPSLNRVHDAIDACRVCEREVGHGYRKIIGLRRGESGRIFVVGEQPGRREAATAMAFAGAAGTVLNKWLVSSGANPSRPRSGIYFTSLVKCVAPKRAAALQRMIRNCRPFLVQQLATVQPRLVITLGKHAYEW